MPRGEKQGILAKKAEERTPFLKNMKLFSQICKKRLPSAEDSPFFTSADGGGMDA
jgi:hypothetical protein